MIAVLMVVIALVAFSGYATARCLQLHIELRAVRQLLAESQAWRKDREELDAQRESLIRAIVRSVRQPEVPRAPAVPSNIAWQDFEYGTRIVALTPDGPVGNITPHGWQSRRH